MAGGWAGEWAGKRYIMGCAQPESQLFLESGRGDKSIKDLAGHRILPVIKEEIRNVCPCRCQGGAILAICESSGKGREGRAATDNEVNNGARPCGLQQGGYRLSRKKGFLTERAVKHCNM